MKYIRISLDAPVLPGGINLTLTATSWQISKNMDFDTPENILHESLLDTVNLLEYRTALNIDNSAVVYIRTKYHFGEKESNWSRIIPLKGNQEGMKLSNAIVATPTLNVVLDFSLSNKGHILITGSDFLMFTSVGSHLSTTWEITSTDGEIVLYREEDKTNLTTLKMDASLFDPYKAYEIKATYHSSTNTKSNAGRFIYNTSLNANNLYKIKALTPLLVNVTEYFNLEVYTPLYEYIDIIIKDSAGNIVNFEYNQYTMLPEITGSNLIINEVYSIYSRIHLTNGYTTNYALVYTGISKLSTVSNYDENITYLNKLSYLQDFIMGGMSVQTTKELSNGAILIANAGKSDLIPVYSYNTINLELSTGGLVLPANTDIEIPYVNILPLDNNKVLVNYTSTVEGDEYNRSIFSIYTHNTANNSFILNNETVMNNLLFSTAVSGSAVVGPDGTIYFIPAMEVDANDDLVDLSIYKMNTTTYEISKVDDLPFSANAYVSLAMSAEYKLIILGGCQLDSVNDLVYERTNNSVYEYNLETSIFTEIFTLPVELSVNVYNLQCFMRKDGRIVGFNATAYSTETGNQDTLLIDLFNDTIQVMPSDTADELSYRNTVRLTSGDILRITSNEHDPQKVFLYVSNTMLEASVVDDPNIVAPVTDLVVAANEEVYVENMYAYETVTINGTSALDSGKLFWVTDDKVLEFGYKDLIITRDTSMTKAEYEAGTWERLLVLDGVVFNIIS